MTKKTEERLKFILETDHISEISSEGDSDWSGEGIHTMSTERIAEMTKGDEKPYFVEFTALYEGLSDNHRLYTKGAVESCAKAMLGVNMYKGHLQPGNEDWQYREPVGQVVATRTAVVEIEGRRVLVAKGKAYITTADAKLRGDIDRKMAGPLSILGDARSFRELGSNKRTITHIHKPLKSVDFCNPGTNGMALAGVTAVVREMSGNDDPEPKEPTMSNETLRLSREQLLSDYTSEITSIVSEKLNDRISEMATQKQELSDKEVTFKIEKKELETKIAEMTTATATLTEECDAAKKEAGELKDKLILADLKVYAIDAIKEMSESDAHDDKLVALASSDLIPEVVENDLDKSKGAFLTRLKSAVERTEKVVEMTGGKIQDPSPTATHKGNRKGGTESKGGDDNKLTINDILSPDLKPKQEA